MNYNILLLIALKALLTKDLNIEYMYVLIADSSN